MADRVYTDKLFNKIIESGLGEGLTKEKFDSAVESPDGRKFIYDKLTGDGVTLAKSYEDFDAKVVGSTKIESPSGFTGDGNPYHGTTDPKYMAVVSEPAVVTAKLPNNALRKPEPTTMKSIGAKAVPSHFETLYKDDPDAANYGITDFSQIPKVYKQDPQAYQRLIKKAKADNVEDWKIYKGIEEQPLVRPEDIAQSAYMKDISNAFHESAIINPVGAVTKDLITGASNSTQSFLDGIDLISHVASNAIGNSAAMSPFKGMIDKVGEAAGGTADKINEYNKQDSQQFHGKDEVSKFINESVQGVGSSYMFYPLGWAAQGAAKAIGYSNIAAKALGVMAASLPEAETEAGGVYRDLGKKDSAVAPSVVDGLINMVLIPTTEWFSGIFDGGKMSKTIAGKILNTARTVGIEGAQEYYQQEASNYAEGKPLEEGASRAFTTSILTSLLAVPHEHIASGLSDEVEPGPIDKAKNFINKVRGKDTVPTPQDVVKEYIHSKIDKLDIPKEDKKDLHTSLDKQFNDPEFQKGLNQKVETASNVAQSLDAASKEAAKVPEAVVNSSTPEEFYNATFGENASQAKEKVESTDEFIKIQDKVNEILGGSYTKEEQNNFSHIVALGMPDGMTETAFDKLPDSELVQNFKYVFQSFKPVDIINIKADDTFNREIIDRGLLETPKEDNSAKPIVQEEVAVKPGESVLDALSKVKPTKEIKSEEVKPAEGNKIVEEQKSVDIKTEPLAEVKTEKALPKDNAAPSDIKPDAPETSLDGPEEMSLDEEIDAAGFYEQGKEEPIEPGRYVQFENRNYIVTKQNENGTFQIYSPIEADNVKKLSVKADNLVPMKSKAVMVEHNGNNYMVTPRNNIISLATNKQMEWAEDNGDRQSIIGKANELRPISLVNTQISPIANNASVAVQRVAMASPLATQQQAIPIQQTSIKDVKATMELKKLHTEGESKLFNFLLDKAGRDIKIQFIDNNTKVGSSTAGAMKVNASYSPSRDIIYINKDRVNFNDPKAYKTILHETIHASLNDAMINNLQFRNKVAKIAYDFKNSIDEDFENTHKEELGGIYGNEQKTPFEFMAYALTNNDISDYMKRTDSKGTSHFARVVAAAKEYFSKLFGLNPKSSMWDEFESVMAKHTGYESSLNVNNFIKNSTKSTYKNDMGTMDIESLLSPEGQSDKSASVIGRMMTAYDNTIGDPIRYIKNLNKKQFISKLWALPEWNLRIAFHYDDNYKDKMSFDEYKQRITTSIYNYIQNLSQRDTYRIVDGKLVALGSNWVGEKNEPKNNWYSNIRLEEYLPKLSEIFGDQFKICYLEKVVNGSVWADVNSSRAFEDSRNKEVNDIVSRKGGIFLGTWADKNTNIFLMPTNGINVEAKKALLQMYGDKIKSLSQVLSEKAKNTQDRTDAQNYAKIADGEEKTVGDIIKDFDVPDEAVDNFINNGGDIFGENLTKEQLGDLGIPLDKYQEYKELNSIFDGMLMRIVLHDLRFGGDPMNGQSKLFNIDDKGSYDAIKILKRPDLISPMYKAYYEAEEAQEALKGVSASYGMSVENGKLNTSVMILNDSPSEGTIDIDGTQYNLHDLFVNSLGTDRGDGVCLYVDGGFNKVYEKMQGTLKEGAIKAAITNAYGELPLFSKMSIQSVSADCPLGKYLLNQGVTLSIFASAAKISGYNKTEYGAEADKFQVPFENLQRQAEKAGVKDGARGLSQSLTANFMTKDNAAFAPVQKKFDAAIRYMEKFLVDKFHGKMRGLNEMSVLDYLKKNGIESTSSYEMAASQIILNLAYGMEDKTVSDIKKSIARPSYKVEREIGNLTKSKEYFAKKFDSTKDEKKLAEYKAAIDKVDEKISKFEDEYDLTVEKEEALERAIKAKELRDASVSQKIGGILNDPYFSKVIQSVIERSISETGNYKVPASYQVLRPDLGVLSGDYKCARGYARSIALQNNTLETEGLEKQLKEMNEKYSSLKEKQEELTEEDQAFVKERDDVIAKIEKNNDYFKSPEAKEAIDKQTAKWFDESGHIKEGYAMISKEYADEYDVKPGDDIVHAVVPSDGLHALGTSQVIGILGNHAKGSIILNSEYVQTRLGKDFDIDTIYVMAKNDAVPKENFDTICKSLKEAGKAYRQQTINVYRNVLSNTSIDLGRIKKTGKELTEAEIYSKPVQLAYLQKFNDANPGSKLINPLYAGQELLDKYTKDGIGTVINTRKTMTLFSQTGLRSAITLPTGEKVVLDGSNKGLFKAFLDLQAKTNAYVDAPTNENSLFFSENKVKNFDKMFGSDVDKIIGQIKSPAMVKAIKNKIDAITAANKALFDYGLMLNKDGNLDDYGGKRELPDTLKYFRTQQQVLSMIDKGDKEGLKKYVFDKIREGNPQAIENQSYTKTISEYIDNLTMEEPYANINMRTIKDMDLSTIPNIGITKEELVKINGNVRKSFEENNEAYKTYMADKTLQGDDRKYSGEKEEAIKTFYYTKQSSPLHELKCKALALMTPTSQTVYNKETLAKDNDYRNDIYNANQYAYPEFMKILLDSKNIEFQKPYIVLKKKDAKTYAQSGVLTKEGFKFGAEDAVFISYEDGQMVFQTYSAGGQKYQYTAQEIYDGKDAIAKRLREALTGEGGLFDNPSNRHELSEFVNLRGRSVPIAKRTEVTLDLLNREMPEFSDTDKSNFWLSLAGDGSGFSCPVNFDSYNGSKDKMYELMSGVKDTASKQALYDYAEGFTREANKIIRPLSQSQKIKTLIEEKATPEELFMELGGEDMPKSEPEEDVKKLVYDSIFDLMRKSKTKEDMLHLATIYDAYTGVISPVTGKQAKQNRFAYVTRADVAINMPMVEMSKLVGTYEGLNQLRGQYDQMLNETNGLIRGIAESERSDDGDASKTIGSRVKEITEKVNTIAEENPDNITFGFDPFKGTIYYVNGVETAKEDLHDAMGRSDLRDAALNIMEIHSHKIPMLMQNTIDYIDSEIKGLSAGFKDTKAIEKLKERLEKDLAAMKAMNGKYIPHMFEQKVAKKIILEDLKAEKLKEAEAKGLSGKEAEKYASKQAKKEFAYMSIDKYGPAVDSFELKRKIISDKYIKNTTAIHNDHCQKVLNVIANTLTGIQSMQYEYKAAMQNTPAGEINAMKKWFANCATDRTLQEEFRANDKLKKGDRIAFLKNDHLGEPVRIKGTVSKVENGKVYLAVNPEAYEAVLDKRIAKAEELSKKIHGDRKATDKQNALLNELGYDGVPLSVGGANDTILELLKALKSNPDEWGAYKAKDIYTTQYIDGKATPVSGAMKQVYNMATVPGKPNLMEILSRNKHVEHTAAILNSLISCAFLSTPGAGYKNIFDAEEALMRDLGVTTYHAISKDADNFLNNFIAYRDNAVSHFGFDENKVKSTLRFGKKTVEHEQAERKSTAAIQAYNYCLKEGLLFEYNERNAIADINTGVLSKATSKLTSSFSKAEFQNRVRAAYIFAYKAAVVDKLDDSDEIKAAIEKGVGRTQAMYDAINRSLNDNTQLGHLWNKFRQYPWFMRQIEKMKSDQAKVIEPKDMEYIEKTIGGKKIKIPRIAKDIFATVDPNINQKRVYEFWFDTIAMTAGNFVPGLNTGNPVNKVYGYTMQFAFQLLFHYLDDGKWPDNWDLKDFFFTLASFKFGFLPTLPFNLLYNTFFTQPSKNESLLKETSRLAGNPRVAKGWTATYNLISTLFSTNHKRNGVYNESMRIGSAASKVFFSIDPFPKPYNKYLTKEQNERNALWPFLRPFKEPEKLPLITIPGLNMMESK